MKYTEKEVKLIVAKFVTEWSSSVCQWETPEDVLKDINSGETPLSLPKREVTREQYDEIIAMKPEDRVLDFQDPIKNKILGILLAYSKKYYLRDGWNDILTTRDAEKEIKQLIIDCGGV